MAVTCRRCGYAYNTGTATNCAACNAQLVNVPPVPVPAGGGTPGPTTPPPQGPQGGSSPAPRGGQGTPAPAVAHPPHGKPASMTGRIVHLERVDEVPPKDPYRTLALILIWILIIVPYVFFFMIFGAFSIVFGLLRFQALSQFFNPIAWTIAVSELIELFVLRGLKRTDTVPIYRGTLEDTLGQDQHFIMIGPLEGASLVEGRQVKLSGIWRLGTLHADIGRDVVTGSVITPRNRNRWKHIFYIMLYLYAGLFLLLLFSALQAGR